MNDLWNPLQLSLRIAAAATVVSALVAVPLALFMARRKFKGRSVIDGLIIAPMVLPPTVVGYAIIMLLGSRGWIGQWIYHAFSYSIIFRFEGAVLAAAVVSMPLLYLPAKAGFASVEREFEDHARVFGATRWQVYWHVSLPLARRGIYSGLLLAFARALGEFGATMMVFGWQAGKITLPISVYADYVNDDWAHAAPAVVALAAISLALTIAFNRSSASMQE